LGSGSACLRGALCVAPFEKMPRFTQIRSGTSPQVTWRPRSAACPRNAPPTRCHPTIRLGGPWGNGSYVQFLPAPPQAATSSVAICQTNCGWPRIVWGLCQPRGGTKSVRRVAPSLGSGSAWLRGALCLAPFEKMPRFTEIRSGTSPQVTWRSRSAACLRYAPPTWCHRIIPLRHSWRNGSCVHFMPAPSKADPGSVAICLANSGWPLTDSAWSNRRVAPIWSRTPVRGSTQQGTTQGRVPNGF